MSIPVLPKEVFEKGLRLTKKDRKDLKATAMLVKDGHYREVNIPEDTYQELCEMIDRMVQRMSSY